MATFNEEHRDAPQREEPPLKNNYGGISAKKPLISKDHERAYFDSADWVLGKQSTSNSPKGPTEPLKPKMQRTAYHQLPPRRPASKSGGTE
ncbi:uncharacterized protein LOC100833173 [Brachypodium distachyon]|uniref:Endosulphine n=1 Tax=Brachypodium distachyon TaxID=15368 RepID=I1HEV7_BRADI|nr:uncharacterized protein LOC100833173 [Brachypodium distachyon]XP_024314973.1 uncharacterized protein LOC100833173 [Brachypodium distachyon]KQK04096.1 hypothetical protein BRADI_2g11664v3 [Brachypodium distachyon]|eukprot:XP_003567592.1 uncharacterized protein LOC100833173 [Brachypodium distachyon]